MPKSRKSKRVRRQRRQRRTRRLRQQRGGVYYEELALSILPEQYATLEKDKKYYYGEQCVHHGEQCVHQRLSREEGRRRAFEAGDLPIITPEEYETLTPEQKRGWVKTSEQVGAAEHVVRYRRRTPEDDRRNYEASIPGKIALGRNLTQYEYDSLTDEQRALGWVETSEQVGAAEHVVRYRRRTEENVKANAKAKAAKAKANFEASIPGKVTLNLPLSKAEVDSLSPNMKALGWLEIDPGIYQKLNFVLNQPKITLTQPAYSSLTDAQRDLFSWKDRIQKTGWFSSIKMYDGTRNP
jgi:hypothetical protein